MTATVLKMLAAHDDSENLDAPKYSFDEFYKLYPRRVARKDAEKAWSQIDPAKHRKIFEALPLHKNCPDWRKEAGKFIPYPASWLRGERWEDEMESDLSMGMCVWNINGNRGTEPRCEMPGAMEKNGSVYCKLHGSRV